MAEFFHMGGYAAFVWPSYGLAALVFIGVIWQSLADLRAQKRLVDKLETRRRNRKPEDGA
ncbi:heme exporter protein D [Parvibaculum indicum]|uniref:heme exporter protein CcmD n=1 Tax=Parvibaculum indicum TaxID=562969 RepID=UPI00141EAE19|nr:heme exporter protein CcmD [Parvibaculum indicum]NIJ41273.1 heme exporter protein D [Parvibaculum indicum]